MDIPGGMGMSRGFGRSVMRDPFPRRRGFGWWWFGPLALIFIFARLALLALPIAILMFILYASIRR